jgi:hypothetical protein
MEGGEVNAVGDTISITSIGVAVGPGSNDGDDWARPLPASRRVGSSVVSNARRSIIFTGSVLAGSASVSERQLTLLDR